MFWQFHPVLLFWLFSASPLGTIIMMATSTAVMASTLAASNYCHRHHHHNHQGWFWYLEPPHPHDLDHGHNHDNLDPDNHDHDNTVIRDVLGTWKHYNLSAETLAARNTRARSPLQSRELDRSSLLIIVFIINILLSSSSSSSWSWSWWKRYFETRKRVNYIGDCSAGGTSDFRYYNYRSWWWWSSASLLEWNHYYHQKLISRANCSGVGVIQFCVV